MYNNKNNLTVFFLTEKMMNYLFNITLIISINNHTQLKITGCNKVKFLLQKNNKRGLWTLKVYILYLKCKKNVNKTKIKPALR